MLVKWLIFSTYYCILQFKDESSLIWISSSGERSLKLASVSRIIPGQRTVSSLISITLFDINRSDAFNAISSDLRGLKK